MKVSVILPVFNGADTLPETIKSILDQSYGEIELIIVDDGSTDNSSEIIKSFKDDRVKYFYQENSGGPASPRNNGIRKSSGELIAFCDQNDIWYPKKLEKLTAVFQKCSQKEKVGIIFSSADLIDEKGKKIGENKSDFEGFLSQKEGFKKLLLGDFITACSAMVPRKVINKIGQLDEGLKGVDEYDLWLRIAKKYGILAEKEPLCAWRSLGGALSVDKTRLYLETEKIFDKLGNKSEEIRIGHGKNWMRVFVSLILKNDYDRADKIVKKIKKYPISKKAAFLVKLFEASNVLASIFVKGLLKIGKISL